MGQQEVVASSSRALPRAQAGSCARGKVRTVGHKGWVQQGARYTAPAAEQESRKLQEEPRGKSRRPIWGQSVLQLTCEAEEVVGGGSRRQPYRWAASGAW